MIHFISLRDCSLDIIYYTEGARGETGGGGGGCFKKSDCGRGALKNVKQEKGGL
jgi:hypothetical protein